MKKLIIIIYIIFFSFTNFVMSEEISLNTLLKDGYTISKDETKTLGSRVIKIYRLEKKKDLYLCLLSMNVFEVLQNYCFKP